MWINGRRAVRPDGGYYRRQRRTRVERGTRLTAAVADRRRAGGGAVWLIGAAIALGAVVFFVVRAVW